MGLLHNYFFPGLFVLLVLIPVVSWSQSPSLMHDQEIEHLLVFVEHSPCTFIRNGKQHSGEKARAHIQKKLNYVRKKKPDISAEEFVEYAASRSSISKKPYTVQCETGLITSESWLLEELERYRQLPGKGVSDQ